MVSSEDMGPATFVSMTEATKAISMGEAVIRYSRNNGRDFIRMVEGWKH